jgi:hypothetical protein
MPLLVLLLPLDRHWHHWLLVAILTVLSPFKKWPIAITTGAIGNGVHHWMRRHACQMPMARIPILSGPQFQYSEDSACQDVVTIQ